MISGFNNNEFKRDLVNWCKHHFNENLVAVGLFNPAKVNSKFPSGDINVLIVLNMAPENERERYDLVTEILIQNLAEDKTFTCRVQTAGELNVLSSLQLPLIDIYMSDVELLYDPRKVLESVHDNLIDTTSQDH